MAESDPSWAMLLRRVSKSCVIPFSATWRNSVGISLASWVWLFLAGSSQKYRPLTAASELPRKTMIRAGSSFPVGYFPSQRCVCMRTAHVMVTLQLRSVPWDLDKERTVCGTQVCLCSQGLQCTSLQDKQLASAHGDLAAQSSC